MIEGATWGDRLRGQVVGNTLQFSNVSEATGMKEKQNTSVKPSEPDKVDAYMQKLKHPLVEVVEALRRIILSTDREVGEEIKWNAPTFFYTGAMKPFNPKEY